MTNMNAVQRRPLGSSGLRVSSVALGCWPIAGMTSLGVTETESLKTVHAAIDSGINFLDTAYCYGADGVSERLVGKAIAGRRDSVVVATKCGVHWGPETKHVLDGNPDRLKQECDESLVRMQTDHVDLMYLHRPDPNIPLEESAGAFLEMKQLGKIRSVGASNFNVQELKKFHAVCPIVAVQSPFNMLQTQIQDEIVPWCQENNVSIVNYWPLMKGLLAGKIRHDFQFDPQDKRLTYEIFQGEQWERGQNVVDELELIAKEIQIEISQLVVAWTIHQPFITSALCGAKRDWQIQETAESMQVALSDDVIERLTMSSNWFGPFRLGGHCARRSWLDEMLIRINCGLTSPTAASPKGISFERGAGF